MTPLVMGYKIVPKPPARTMPFIFVVLYFILVIIGQDLLFSLSLLPYQRPAVPPALASTCAQRPETFIFY